MRRTPAAVVARDGDRVVSVTRFALLRPYDPSRFDAVAKELDGVAAKLASRTGGRLVERTTTTVDGSRIRAYRYTDGNDELRLGFVLRGKREYQLLCRLPAGGDDPDDACRVLFESFSAT